MKHTIELYLDIQRTAILLEANIKEWNKLSVKNIAGLIKRPSPRSKSDLPDRSVRP